MCRLLYVGEELQCQREGANSEDLFEVVVTTGALIIIGHEKFLQCAQCFYNKIGQFSGDLLVLWLKEAVSDIVSKKFLEEEIFVGTNFCELICLIVKITKISAS